MEAKDAVLSALKKAGKPMKASEIADSSGIDKKEIDKAIKKLTTEDKVHSPQRCYFDIKK
ncbi:MAG: MarR family transcriptional regulator [Bacteroidota bacterium]